MAAGQHNPSRRALLGAAVALPLVGGMAASPGPRLLPAKPGEELAWTGALDAYEAAEEEVREAEGWPADFEDDYDERVGALCEALRRLWRTPAPNLRALALKIDLAIDHELGTLSGGEACLAAIRGDAQRLAAAYPGL